MVTVEMSSFNFRVFNKELKKLGPRKLRLQRCGAAETPLEGLRTDYNCRVNKRNIFI